MTIEKFLFRKLKELKIFHCFIKKILKDKLKRQILQKIYNLFFKSNKSHHCHQHTHTHKVEHKNKLKFYFSHNKKK